MGRRLENARLPTFRANRHLMRTLHIDIETYSPYNLKEVGVYKYCEGEGFKVLLFAFAYDDEAVRVIDCATAPATLIDALPARVVADLRDPLVLKIAHNASFEVTVLSCVLGYDLDPSQWFCTMIGAAYYGLPLGLEKVAEVLRLPVQKDAKGKALITYFCRPCKPTKSNGGRTLNRPTDDAKKWSDFIEYNRRDVEVEQAIYHYLLKFKHQLPESERAAWVLDQRTNARGVCIDTEFIEAAKEQNDEFIDTVRSELKRLTGVANPNSLQQLKRWLKEQTGNDFGNLAKESLADYIADPTTPKAVKKVLKLRQLGSKTSIKKYDTMLAYKQADGRVRGLLQFYGANRTGRYAGRGIQVQNLKKTLKKNLLQAREAVLTRAATLIYEDVSDIISRLTRTALVAAAGKSFAVSDFSAIEARVLAWEAGEEWVLDVFRTHGKIYEATAANMFNVPIETVTKDGDLRPKGKVATLALGYQGGSGALVKMGALREGLKEEELPAIVKKWRRANPNIVKFWKEVENAAKRAITERREFTLKKKYTSFKFGYERGYLYIELPSGRRLYYYGAQVRDGRVFYYGLNQTTKQRERIDTYGGSLVENITQAVARDCLVEALFMLEAEGVNVLMHIHDEVVAEEADDEADNVLKVIDEVMSTNSLWNKGLPLKGDGYITKFYKKD